MPAVGSTMGRPERDEPSIGLEERAPSAQVLEFLKGKFETATG
jgi:hypothetical protein